MQNLVSGSNNCEKCHLLQRQTQSLVKTITNLKTVLFKDRPIISEANGLKEETQIQRLTSSEKQSKKNVAAVETLQKKIEELELTISASESKDKQYKSIFEDFEEKVKDYERKEKLIKQELKETKKKQKDNKDYTKTIEDLKASLQEVKKENRRILEENKRLNIQDQSIKELQETISKLTMRRDELFEANETFQQRIQLLEEANTKFHSSRKDFQDIVKPVEELTDWSNIINELKETIKQLTYEKNQQLKECQLLQKSKSHAETEVEALKIKCSKFQDELKIARDKLENERRNKNCNFAIDNQIQKQLEQLISINSENIKRHEKDRQQAEKRLQDELDTKRALEKIFFNLKNSTNVSTIQPTTSLKSQTKHILPSQLLPPLLSPATSLPPQGHGQPPQPTINSEISITTKTSPPTAVHSQTSKRQSPQKKPIPRKPISFVPSSTPLLPQPLKQHSEQEIAKQEQEGVNCTPQQQETSKHKEQEEIVEQQVQNQQDVVKQPQNVFKESSSKPPMSRQTSRKSLSDKPDYDSLQKKQSLIDPSDIFQEMLVPLCLSPLKTQSLAKEKSDTSGNSEKFENQEPTYRSVFDDSESSDQDDLDEDSDNSVEDMNVDSEENHDVELPNRANCSEDEKSIGVTSNIEHSKDDQEHKVKNNTNIAEEYDIPSDTNNIEDDENMEDDYEELEEGSQTNNIGEDEKLNKTNIAEASEETEKPCKMNNNMAAEKELIDRRKPKHREASSKIEVAGKQTSTQVTKRLKVTSTIDGSDDREKVEAASKTTNMKDNKKIETDNSQKVEAASKTTNMKDNKNIETDNSQKVEASSKITNMEDNKKIEANDRQKIEAPSKTTSIEENKKLEITKSLNISSNNSIEDVRMKEINEEDSNRHQLDKVKSENEAKNPIEKSTSNEKLLTNAKMDKTHDSIIKDSLSQETPELNVAEEYDRTLDNCISHENEKAEHKNSQQVLKDEDKDTLENYTAPILCSDDDTEEEQLVIDEGLNTIVEEWGNRQRRKNLNDDPIFKNFDENLDSSNEQTTSENTRGRQKRKMVISSSPEKDLASEISAKKPRLDVKFEKNISTSNPNVDKSSEKTLFNQNIKIDKPSETILPHFENGLELKIRISLPTLEEKNIDKFIENISTHIQDISKLVDAAFEIVAIHGKKSTLDIFHRIQSKSFNKNEWTPVLYFYEERMIIVTQHILKMLPDKMDELKTIIVPKTLEFMTVNNGDCDRKSSVIRYVAGLLRVLNEDVICKNLIVSLIETRIFSIDDLLISIAAIWPDIFNKNKECYLLKILEFSWTYKLKSRPTSYIKHRNIIRQLIQWKPQHKANLEKLLKELFEKDWPCVQHCVIIWLSLIDHRKLRTLCLEKLLSELKNSNLEDSLPAIVNICYCSRPADETFKAILDYLLERLRSCPESEFDRLKMHILKIGDLIDPERVKPEALNLIRDTS
ncbi:DgyrCDS4964 [Dimorphilus gyrociliatus]|uniref:DgyrCDS4964 n=1 Tax=Dimorphilus gyrociliatus TaxID=2664684 RepID=A0A7I8VKQ4_9ANNE|nr:DgyrCDS4964 [Dimorphilus gyrociliatus]